MIQLINFEVTHRNVLDTLPQKVKRQTFHEKCISLAFHTKMVQGVSDMKTM